MQVVQIPRPEQAKNQAFQLGLGCWQSYLMDLMVQGQSQFWTESPGYFKTPQTRSFMAFSLPPQGLAINQLIEVFNTVV